MSSDQMIPSKSLERQNALVCVSVIFTGLSFLIVSLRVYTRALIVRNIGKDDWAMVAALIFTIGYLVTILVLRQNGVGIQGAILTLDQMTNILKTILAVELIYYLCVNAIKISIVLLYLRIAADKTFARLCKGTIIFLGLFCTICIIVVLAQCKPLHKMWDLTGMVQGTCINTTAFFYMTSATNIVIDLWIIGLPVKILTSIQRPNREKYALIGVFALGVLSCIASIVRLHSIRIFTMSKDPFYDNVPVNIWSMVEVNVGIWCACIPSLKALFSKAQRERSQASGYQHYGSGRTGTSGTKGSQFKQTGNGTLGGITRNEEVIIEMSQPSKENEKKQTVATGGWYESNSQERIIVPEHKV